MVDTRPPGGWLVEHGIFNLEKRRLKRIRMVCFQTSEELFCRRGKEGVDAFFSERYKRTG